MTTLGEACRVIAFDGFEFDRRTLELTRDGVPVKLQQQPARVLAELTANAGDLVTRETLRRTLWDDGTFVDFERGLNYCISQIRMALGDSAEAPRYLETLRGRGYRFIAGIHAMDDGLRPAAASRATTSDALADGHAIRRDAPSADPASAGRRTLRTLRVAAALLIVLVATWAARIAYSRMTAPRIAIGVAAFSGPVAEREWTEALRNQVIGRLSAFSHTPIIDLTQPGSAGVHTRWRIEGRVDRSSAVYRVTMILRDTRDGGVPWSDIFAGPPGEWIGAQSEMAQRMTEAIRYRIEGERAGLPKRRSRLGPGAIDTDPGAPRPQSGK